jgi:hypothetical protein
MDEKKMAELVWGMNEKSIKNMNTSRSIRKMKNGMSATVPMICKGADCPYINTCYIDTDELQKGARCPIECGVVLERFEIWCRHFNIDLSGETLNDEDIADASLIRDLVDNEVKTIRAENKMAMDADFVEKTITNIDDKGNVYWEDKLSNSADYQMKLQDKRYKILNLLNATRKDKASHLKDITIGEKSLSVFKKIQAEQEVDLDDLQFNKEGEQ